MVEQRSYTSRATNRSIAVIHKLPGTNNFFIPTFCLLHSVMPYVCESHTRIYYMVGYGADASSTEYSAVVGNIFWKTAASVSGSRLFTHERWVLFFCSLCYIERHVEIGGNPAKVMWPSVLPQPPSTLKSRVYSQIPLPQPPNTDVSSMTINYLSISNKHKYMIRLYYCICDVVTKFWP